MAETEPMSYGYFLGWSHVDFKRFMHFQPGSTTQTTSQVSFLCPNNVHMNWLDTFVREQLGLGPASIRVLKNDPFNAGAYIGHAIIMLTVPADKPTLMRDMKSPFADGLLAYGLPFLRGYLDHQVVILKYRKSKTRFSPYPVTIAHGIKITFSHVEHFQVISKYQHIRIPESEWKIDEQRAGTTMVTAYLHAPSAIAFLSILVGDQSDDCPPLYSKFLIPKLESYIRRDREPISVRFRSTRVETLSDIDSAAPDSADTLRSDAGFTLTIPVKEMIVDYGLWGGPIHIVLKSGGESELPLPVEADVSVQPADNTKESVVSFLDKCVVSARKPTASGLALLFFGTPDSVPVAEDLQLCVTHRRRQWSVLNKEKV